MANPASLTVQNPTENAFAAIPAAQTIDTAGTVPIACGGNFAGKLLIQITNASGSNTCTATVKAGADKSLAFRGALGDLASGTIATSGTAQVLIDDTARFAKTDGTIDITFAGTSPNISVRVYRM